MKSSVTLGGMLLLAGVAGSAHAQNYPARPVRMMVPYAPGGGVDIMGRIVAAKLSEKFGVQFVVDNRGGGASVIGTDIVAKASPDGYTLLMANPSLAANPAMMEKLPYDAVRSFTPVIAWAESYNVLVVHPSMPVKTTKELVALAKSKPGQLNYASAGDGSAIYLAMALFENVTGINLVHIPYKGAGPAITDVLGGQVSIMFAATPPVVQHASAGRLRALGVSSAKRLDVLPSVPTIAESGFPQYVLSNWYAVMAPAKTPDAIVNRLNAELNTMLQSADVKERIAALGAEPGGGTPAQFTERLRKEIDIWAKVLKKPKA